MSNSKSVIFVENKKKMTLYEALDAFKDIRDTAISTESKRKIESVSQDWQSVNTNMTLYYNTISSGNTSTADVYIDEIIAILAGHDLTVDLPVQFPLSLSVFASPSTIQVPVNASGLNPDYTNALSTVSVYIGGVDDSANWSYAVTSSSNATAAIQNTNEVKVSDLSANSGSITIEISKTGYTTITFYISANKGYAGVVGPSGGTIQNINYSIQALDTQYTTGNDRGAGAVDLQTAGDLATAVASGDYSVLTGGLANAATGDGSFVGSGNKNTSAGGNSAIPGGQGITANTWCEFVVGSYPEEISGDSGSFTATDPIFRIGNGVSTGARSDAFKVLKNGGVFASGLKSGANQGAAGAAADEIWIDAADNSLKIGV